MRPRIPPPRGHTAEARPFGATACTEKGVPERRASPQVIAPVHLNAHRLDLLLDHDTKRSQQWTKFALRFQAFQSTNQRLDRRYGGGLARASDPVFRGRTGR